MKTNNIKTNLKPLMILLIFIVVISAGQSQNKNIQIQIGGQIMQNYNLGGLESLYGSYVGIEIKEEKWGFSFNQDLSISYLFNNNGVILGSGFYTTKNILDIVYTDDIGSQDEYQIILTQKNFNIYLLYQYTHWLSPTWNIHASVGPMWAKNHNQGDWFFVPVKLNYFSGIGKLGVQYMINDHFSLDLNGMAVRSLTNIVDQSQGTTGSIIPFLVGLDFRVGYQF